MSGYAEYAAWEATMPPDNPIERYDHYPLREFAATDAMWNEGPVVLVRSKFHGGGIVSRHRTVRAAWRAYKAMRADDCGCGCAGIIPASDYERLPRRDAAWSACDLCQQD